MNKPVTVREDRQILHAVLREDFGAFIARVFSTVSPGDMYLHNWHIDAISQALMTSTSWSRLHANIRPIAS
jgi:hypothetical protein